MRLLAPGALVALVTATSLLAATASAEEPASPTPAADPSTGQSSGDSTGQSSGASTGESTGQSIGESRARPTGKSTIPDCPRHPPQVGSPPPASATGDGFAFGSYGRAGVGIDGGARAGTPVNIVSYGSRLEAAPYVELDFYYGASWKDGGRWRAVIAPAFQGDPFHYTGDFASRFALRNAYVETDGIGWKGLRLWAGSRMYRGDDVYLFDFWPLDNLNTVGGGIGLRIGEDNDLAIHGGQSRLNNPFQRQVLTQPARGLGPPTQVLQMDRPRSTVTAKFTRFIPRGEAGVKLSAYGELHFIPDGDYKLREQERAVDLPREFGWVAGLQLGGWLRPMTFLNLFFRYAGGLAAWGDLRNPPLSTGPVQRDSATARELVGALSLNWEHKRLGIMAGAWIREFRDNSPDERTSKSWLEGAAAVRPTVYLLHWLHLAAEVSYQQRAFNGPDPLLGRVLNPKVFRASIFPLFSPNGPGGYSRPNLYTIYTVSVLDQDARDTLWDPTDIRYGSGAGSSVVHYFGVGAEWWFQSSYR